MREDDGPALPVKATAIVLSTWVFVLVLIAFGLVPLLFAQCAPETPAP
ncbi:MAG TPA: hypothetical protein VFM93_11390 [Candidatus Limnocylindria bacterium]|nr:hypothetical protein [Candidatus Limnocylindria bacterium]